MRKNEIFVLMKRISILLSITLFLFSCNVRRGSGNLVSETMNVGSFSRINVSGPFTVEVKEGEYKVEVEADDNLMKYIDVEVSGNTLRVKATRKNFRNAHLNVYIQAPSLDGIKASMAADISTTGQIRSGNQLVFEASSAAEIRADADAPRVNAKASSGSDIELRGRTRDLDVSSSSGSDIDASNLNAENTNVTASSGADAKVHASRALNANASSGGTVRYRGGAKISQSASSGGEVLSMN